MQSLQVAVQKQQPARSSAFSQHPYHRCPPAAPAIVGMQVDVGLALLDIVQELQP